MKKNYNILAFRIIISISSSEGGKYSLKMTKTIQSP